MCRSKFRKEFQNYDGCLYLIEESIMRERNREELPKPVDLKPLRPEISGLMRAIRNTVKPVINTQMSSHSKSRLVELINQFERQNNYSIKRPRFLQGMEGESLRTLFRVLTKYHHMDLLNKGQQLMIRGGKCQIGGNVEMDVKRIMEYIGSKLVNEYKRSLDLKLKKMRKNKEELHIKLEEVKYHPQLNLLKASRSSRILMGIHERKKEVEMKYGKFNLISDIQSQKQRILCSINNSLY